MFEPPDTANEAGLPARMEALADELAASHDALDFSLESLHVFERVVLQRRADREQLLGCWGAYLGETIRRAIDAEVTWVDFATAARRDSAVAALGDGADLAAILTSGSTYLFPLAKVGKFLDNGSEDSPAAFAPVAVEMLRPKKQEQAPAEVTNRAALDRRGVDAFDSFFAAPSAESLRALSTTGLRRQDLAFLLRERGATAEQFYPFLGAAPSGRGYKRFDPGRVAARYVWKVVAVGIADPDRTAGDLSARLDADMRVRENAAYALGRIMLRHRPHELEQRYDGGDRAVRLGLLGALRSLVLDACMGYDQYPGIAGHAEVLRRALAGNAQQCSLALESIHPIAHKVRVSIAPVLPAMLTVLERGKPAQVETALRALTSHIYAIKHGRAPWTDDVPAAVDPIVRHSRALPGKTKITKVQRAARYALSALRAVEEMLPADQRGAVQAAFAEVAHLR